MSISPFAYILLAMQSAMALAALMIIIGCARGICNEHQIDLPGS